MLVRLFTVPISAVLNSQVLSSYSQILQFWVNKKCFANRKKRWDFSLINEHSHKTPHHFRGDFRLLEIHGSQFKTPYLALLGTVEISSPLNYYIQPSSYISPERTAQSIDYAKYHNYTFIQHFLFFSQVLEISPTRLTTQGKKICSKFPITLHVMPNMCLAEILNKCLADRKIGSTFGCKSISKH